MHARSREAHVRGADVGEVTAGSAHCNIDGCWDHKGQAYAYFTGKGSYGYTDLRGQYKLLGRYTLYFRVVTRNKGDVRAYPFYVTTTRGRKSTELNGEHLYLSGSRPGGASMSPAHYYERPYGPKDAYVKTAWPSPGKSYKDTTQLVTVVNAARWTDPSSAYPGTWWAWAKSIKLEQQSRGNYYVNQSNALPTNHSDSGWDR